MYRRTSWIDPRLAVWPSPIAGRGLFVRSAMPAGEPVVVWGGELVSVYRKSCVAIGEGLYLDGPPDESDFLNHSCDSNLWMQDAVTLVARRDIATGDEVTVDYALFEADEAWIARWRCRCGAPGCRGVVTGLDWRAAALQARYAGHFAPFLASRMRVTRVAPRGAA